MDYVPLESLIDKTNNSLYKLVILASRRAMEIADGQPSLLGPNLATKPSVVALKEIAAQKVGLKQGK